jgi:AcrR family transcriptional regulator
MLETLPDRFASREEFVEAVVSQSFDKHLAMWLAMNLESIESGFRLRLDLAAMRELLTDYFSRDLWSVLEAEGTAIHVVCASRGSALSSDDLSRVENLGPNSGVEVHHLEGGHWLHVDALEPLVNLVAAHLS